MADPILAYCERERRLEPSRMYSTRQLRLAEIAVLEAAVKQTCSSPTCAFCKPMRDALEALRKEIET